MSIALDKTHSSTLRWERLPAKPSHGGSRARSSSSQAPASYPDRSCRVTTARPARGSDGDAVTKSPLVTLGLNGLGTQGCGCTSWCWQGRAAGAAGVAWTCSDSGGCCCGCPRPEAEIFMNPPILGQILAGAEAEVATPVDDTAPESTALPVAVVIGIIPHAAMSETSSNCWKFSVISVSSCLACVVERSSRTSWMAA